MPSIAVHPVRRHDDRIPGPPVAADRQRNLRPPAESTGCSCRPKRGEQAELDAVGDRLSPAGTSPIRTAEAERGGDRGQVADVRRTELVALDPPEIERPRDAGRAGDGRLAAARGRAADARRSRSSSLHRGMCRRRRPVGRVVSRVAIGRGSSEPGLPRLMRSASRQSLGCHRRCADATSCRPRSCAAMSAQIAHAGPRRRSLPPAMRQSTCALRGGMRDRDAQGGRRGARRGAASARGAAGAHARRTTQPPRANISTLGSFSVAALRSSE